MIAALPRAGERILIAEDDAVSRRLLEITLGKWGYDVDTAADGLTAWAKLRADDAPRLAVLDWMMPGMDGPNICRELRRLTDRPYTYVLLLTARDRKEDVVEGLEAGADDYIAKPFDASELRVRLHVGRRLLDLQYRLVEACTALRVQAERDALTGLLNRAAVLKALESQVCQAADQGRPLAVVMADMDHFKQINDTHGHLAGDAVLREAAARFRATLRKGDLVGRYGGEEFLVVVAHPHAENAPHVAERLRRSLAAEPVAWGGRPLDVTASFGVAVTPPGVAPDATDLLHAADLALYEAKRGGRNCVACAGAQATGPGTLGTEAPLVHCVGSGLSA
jgi:diguanylate cyclase (GGDEF)-like protein